MKKSRRNNRNGNPVLKYPLLMVNILFLTLISNSELHAEEYPAELVWMNRVELSMFVSGIIKDVFVKPGDLVVKGKPLVKLDTRIKQAQFEESVAELELQIRLRSEEKRELDRAIELYDRTVLSNHELEVAHIAYARADAAYNSAKAKKVRAEILLEKSTIVAPFDGYVLGLFAETGQTVVSKLQPVTLVTFARSEKMLARMKIEATRLSSIAPGDRVKIKTGGHTFNGSVYTIALEPKKGKDALLYQVDVSFDTQKNRYRAGQPATIILK